jgi:hypothetical protein
LRQYPHIASVYTECHYIQFGGFAAERSSERPRATGRRPLRPLVPQCRAHFSRGPSGGPRSGALLTGD